MNYIANSPVYYHWWPLFTFLLGTGCRIGEAIALRWDDLDFENKMITINHSIANYKSAEKNKCVSTLTTPKTEAGIRTIPMLDVVYDALKLEEEDQQENGFNETVIDGVSGFVFQNRFGNIQNQQAVNSAIKRIVTNYNNEEDSQSVELQSLISEKGVKESLAHVANLAQEQEILSKVEKYYNEVKSIISA